jgi:hypothetical protein
MTPNLTKLFERVRSLEPLYQVVDGVTRSSMDKHIAGQQLAILFAAHGQAIIEALEYYADRNTWGTVHTGNVYAVQTCLPSTDRAKQLLATLEREAGGQP